MKVLEVTGRSAGNAFPASPTRIERKLTMTTPDNYAGGKVEEPSCVRFLLVIGTFLTAIAGTFVIGRYAVAVPSVMGRIGLSIGSGMLAAVLIGSVGEWLVHRYIMHRRLRPFPLTLAYDLHHRAHHWIQYPPHEYVHADRVQRVPISSRVDRVCTSASGRVLTVAVHVAFYAFFGITLAMIPALVMTRNPIFTYVVTGVTVIEIYLFVRVHDAVHHPGLSRLERFHWFQFLDRHHYIHHIDNAANTNFLLPLCDLLMGVLRRELTVEDLSV